MRRFYHREKSLSPNVKRYPIPTPGPTSRAAPGRGFGDCDGRAAKDTQKTEGQGSD